MKGLLGKVTISEARLAGSGPADEESLHTRLTGLALTAFHGRHCRIWGVEEDWLSHAPYLLPGRTDSEVQVLMPSG